MRDRIARALAGTPVVAAWLMGSRARGQAREGSDTDVAVLLPRSTAATNALLADLIARLEDAGVPAPDVHVLNETSLAFQAQAVMRGERVHSTDEEARVRFETWVISRYLDFEPLLELQYRIQRRRLATEGTLGPALDR
jgi:predicted nucleotidyltransferase